MKIIKFTDTELDVIIDHFCADFDYGVYGSWGDGTKFTDDLIMGKHIIKKLRIAQAKKETKNKNS